MSIKPQSLSSPKTFIYIYILVCNFQVILTGNGIVFIVFNQFNAQVGFFFDYQSCYCRQSLFSSLPNWFGKQNLTSFRARVVFFVIVPRHCEGFFNIENKKMKLRNPHTIAFMPSLNLTVCF